MSKACKFNSCNRSALLPITICEGFARAGVSKKQWLLFKIINITNVIFAHGLCLQKAGVIVSQADHSVSERF